MRVHWTERARSRLREIQEYLDAEAPAVASRTIERLVQRSRRIGGVPYAGRTVPEYQQDDLREILEHPYRIIYAFWQTASM